MKLHIPVTLLTVIAATAVHATMRPEVIETVSSGETREASSEFMTHVQDPLITNGSTIGTITKDGQGTLTVSNSYNVSSALNVREGVLYIGNGAEGEHITIQAQPYITGSPTISVGGNNATLVLDNATYKYYVHNSKGNKGYSSAIAIGNLDGSGSIELKNNSVLYTSQSYFAYSTACFDHVQGSFTGTEGDTVYSNGVVGRSSLAVTSGSKLQAGMTFYFADIDITVDGEGSIIEDGVRSIDANKGWLGDDDGSDRTDIVTNVTIQNGGTWTSRHDLVTGCATNATTNILVTGEGSTFNSERNTILGDPGSNSATNLTITDKAVANITDLTVGSASGTEKAIVTIGEDSTLNAGAIKLNEGGEIINNGTISEGSTEKVISWRDDSSMGLSGGSAARTEEVQAGITLEGGSIENAGTIELDIVMTGGQLTAHDGAEFADITALGGIINVDGSITVGSLTLGEVNMAAAEEVAVMTLATADEVQKAVQLVLSQNASINATDVEGLDNAEIIIVLDNYTAGDVLDSGHQYIVGADGETKVTIKNSAGEVVATNVDIRTVPEPATATLSLLALAALAARRRRK